MSKLEKIKKDIKTLEKLKSDIDELYNKRKNEYDERKQLLKLKNCLTCKKKKCLNRDKNLPINNCERYYSKEYKYMLKMKEEIK